MILGYLDTNTKNIDVERQRQQILDYASENGLTVDMFLQESKIESLKSSIKTDNHTLIFANIVALGITLSLLKKLVPDDTLVIENVSFLGQNVHEIITALNAISQYGVNLCLAQENISFKADKLPEIASSLLLAFKIHQSLISLRSKTALQERKAQGKHLGRPYGSNPALTLEVIKKKSKNCYYPACLKTRLLSSTMSAVRQSITLSKKIRICWRGNVELSIVRFSDS